jgi:hypothetical protein
MAETGTHIQAEGTWEEILRRSAEFSGRRVRVTVLDESAAKSLAEVARQWADEAESLEPDNRQPAADPDEFERILVEKFRKQGLQL